MRFGSTRVYCKALRKRKLFARAEGSQRGTLRMGRMADGGVSVRREDRVTENATLQAILSGMKSLVTGSERECGAAPRFSRGGSASLVMMLALSLSAIGCLGWGDMFAARHPISGDYFLMQGESDSSSEVYLMSKWRSISEAGPLYKVGWNQQYIIFTDQNWPTPWNVIRVKDHTKFTITEKQRVTDSNFKGIAILLPSDAWEANTH